MVKIFNKSNKPVGVIGGQYCLPDKSVTLKDKEVFCAVFDENGNDTGEKALLPGLKALEGRGYITIEVIEEKPKQTAKKAEKTETKEEAVEEPVKTTAKKTTRKTTKKVEE